MLMFQSIKYYKGGIIQNIMKLSNYFGKKILFFLLPAFMLGIPSTADTEKNTRAYSITESWKKQFESEVHSWEKRTLKIESSSTKSRKIKVNVALDGVSKEYAKELLNNVSEKYTQEFNISFNAVDFYKHNLPETWRTDLEMEKIRDSSRKRSDVYLLFSDKDWNNKSDSGDFSVVGEAHENVGYAWIETHNKEEDIKNLTHELTHLFGINHDCSKTSFMHRQNSGKIYFTENMRKEILENKFKTWEFSRYEPGKL